MILKNGHSTKYLNDFKDGKIVKGFGLDIVLDDYLRFKRKQLNIILGHDNVGKSYWTEWYFLALSTNHDISHTIWMGENSSGQVMRDLIFWDLFPTILELKTNYTDTEIIFNHIMIKR